MLTQTQAQRIVRNFPWPEFVRRPGVSLEVGPQGIFTCVLRCTGKEGLAVATQGPTSEGCLKIAIGEWLKAMSANEDLIEELTAKARRDLTN